MPKRYAELMAQLVTRIDESLAAQLDQLVTEGVYESRSEAVRQGLRYLVDQHRRNGVGNAISEGYRHHPQQPGEVGWSDAATVAMITDEPW